MEKKSKKNIIDVVEFASVIGLAGTAIANLIGGVRDRKSSANATDDDNTDAVVIDISADTAE